MLSKDQLSRLAPRYCSGNIEDIEGFSTAITSPEKYVLHHRMEIQPDGVVLSKKWMIDHGIYYNVDPCMLIFMSDKEHRRLHSRYPVKKPVTEAQRVHISEAKATAGGFSSKFRMHFGFGREHDEKLFKKEKDFCRYYGFCSWEKDKPLNKRNLPHPERGRAISIAKLGAFGKMFYGHTNKLPSEDSKLYRKLRHLYQQGKTIDWEVL